MFIDYLLFGFVDVGVIYMNKLLDMMLVDT